MPLPTKDSQTNLVNECYAVIYSPKKRRGRFPENCVTVYETAEAAVAASSPEEKLHAAKVVGPSRSSEGFMLYYLVHWLN